MDLARDISAGEKVAGALDVFITRRHDQRVRDEGERLAEEAWAESVARFHERSEAEMRSRWIDFHQNMHRLHSALASEHEAKAGKLLVIDEPKGAL